MKPLLAIAFVATLLAQATPPQLRLAVPPIPPLNTPFGGVVVLNVAIDAPSASGLESAALTRVHFRWAVSGQFDCRRRRYSGVEDRSEWPDRADPHGS